jgi:GMP synthase (glutamine-hydrolysing)
MSIKILLLQARHSDDLALVEERRSFAMKAGISEEQIIPFDMLNTTPTMVDVRKFDALMVGGSGDYYVSKKNLPGFQQVMELLADVVAIGHPTFASCFGFQLLVEALGGRIVYDQKRMEVGTYQLTLTNSGLKDDLFRYLPPNFMAQLGHKDRADRLPEGVLNLAYSQNSPLQALRIPNQPIWATQFHPELNREENLLRFERYLDGYANFMSEDEMKETINRFRESPETEGLIPRFLEVVFGTAAFSHR